ncbi:hypothetical protein MRB53_019231 [Persea americana]|uniref:Uncharacterized protein n=1 Tax=Persea americana TaxID=3435 RepID=A0ACC2KXI3_PERAE|nr:hypothetical protein MRB53_019231 [Persea americana]
MPFGVVMSACARMLETRYREKNYGLVTRRDAEVPGSVVVRPDRKIDHMWMAYTTLNDDPSEADASQVCEALLAPRGSEFLVFNCMLIMNFCL